MELSKPGFNFAIKYLERFDKESKWRVGTLAERGIDREIYSKLVRLDSGRFGTRASDQLYKCLSHTTRSDIIKDIIKV